jgi:hypothetical protein
MSNSSLFLRVSVYHWPSFTDGERGGEGVGEEPKHTTKKKPGGSINNSILSGPLHTVTCSNKGVCGVLPTQNSAVNSASYVCYMELQNISQYYCRS